MNFFKIITLFLLLLFMSISSNNVLADSHDVDQNIVEQAKEINQEILEKQAATEANISSEIGNEEPLPLNDPFAGGESTGGAGSAAMIVGSEEEQDEMSLYNFKLVGIIEGQFETHVTLINATGELMTLQMYDELSQGVRLVAINDKEEAVFEKNEDSYLVINFKNQIRETSGEY
jgi:hypothetical protein